MLGSFHVAAPAVGLTHAIHLSLPFSFLNICLKSVHASCKHNLDKKMFDKQCKAKKPRLKKGPRCFIFQTSLCQN